MPFETPMFWHYTTRVSQALRPLSWLWLTVSRIRYRSVTPVKMPVPVLCVGNLVMGGAGKTPTVIAIIALLKQMGYTPHILSRGYGAIIKDYVRVDPDYHDYLRVGDEPLLLAQTAPTWAGANRIAAAKAAIKHGADVLVLDDGFQNPGIHKDFSILVIDTRQGFGNGLVFPAGPLREPVAQGVQRAQMVVLVGDEPFSESNLPGFKYHPVRARLKGLPMGEPQSVVAFAGLGYPEKFRLTLMEHHFDIKEFITYPDHHPYTIPEVRRLLKIAKYYNAQLITTAKDYLRLPMVCRPQVQTLPVDLVFDDSAHVFQVIKKNLEKAKPPAVACEERT